jgi:hypothetical protein
LSGVLNPASGGTGLTAIPTNGQLLIGNGTGYTLNTLTAGTAIGITNAAGSITLNNTGVTSFQTSISGLTPSTATSGAVTLAGTVGAISGGTSQSTYTTGDTLYASAANTLSKLPIGTNGQQLTVTAGVPTWKPPYVRTSFTATAGQTTFSATYYVGYVQVFMNGVLLNGADYTATNGTSVVLAIAANLGDILETIAYNV